MRRFQIFVFLALCILSPSAMAGDMPTAASMTTNTDAQKTEAQKAEAQKAEAAKAEALKVETPKTEAPTSQAVGTLCLQQCANICSIHSGSQSVDNCTVQCTMKCNRDGGKLPTSPAPDLMTYGAFAISPSTLLYAGVKGMLSREDAEHDAITACENNPGHPSDCQIALWFHGTCGALALKDDPERKDWGWGADWAQTSQAAEAQARRNCNEHVTVKSCEVVTTICAK